LGSFSELLRSPDKHIDQEELDALVPSHSEAGWKGKIVSPEAAKAALHHVASCHECGEKLWKYWPLVNRSSVEPGVGLPTAECPRDVEWYEVALGLWPEGRASQLIAHAALVAKLKDPIWLS